MNQQSYLCLTKTNPQTSFQPREQSPNENIEELDDWALILGQKSNNLSSALTKATQLYRRMRVNFVVNTPRHKRPKEIASFIISYRHALLIAAQQEGKRLHPAQTETCWIQTKKQKNDESVLSRGENGESSPPVGQVYQMGCFTSPSSGKKVYCHAAVDVTRAVLKDVENLRLNKIGRMSSSAKTCQTKDELKNGREAMNVEQQVPPILSNHMHQTDQQELPVILPCPEINKLGGKNETSSYPSKHGGRFQGFHNATANNDCSIDEELESSLIDASNQQHHIAETPIVSSFSLPNCINHHSSILPQKDIYVDSQFKQDLEKYYQIVLKQKIQKLRRNLVQRLQDCCKDGRQLQRHLHSSCPPLSTTTTTIQQNNVSNPEDIVDLNIDMMDCRLVGDSTCNGMQQEHCEFHAKVYPEQTQDKRNMYKETERGRINSAKAVLERWQQGCI